MNGFGDAQASGIAGRQDGAVLDVGTASKKMRDLKRTENNRQFLRLFRAGDDLVKIPRPLERDSIEKAQCRYGQLDRAGGQPLFVRQIELIGADVLRSEKGWRLVEVPGEQRNMHDVGGLRPRRQVSHLHIFYHALPKDRRHRGLRRHVE
jgi:hypothetical protein